MAVTYDFQTPGVSTSAADTQEDIRNIAEMSWVWHVNASPHSLTNKPTGLIEAFYDSTVDFTSSIPSYGYQNYYSLKAYDGTNLGNVNFGDLWVHYDGAVLSNTIGARGEEFISMGVYAGYSCEDSASWIINADVGNSGSSGYDPILAFKNQTTERARIYTDTSDSHKLKFDVGGSDQMVIDSSGNVGIGTSSPSNPLEVREDGTTTPKILVRSISNGDPTMSFLSDSKQFTMGIDDTSNAFAISEGSGLGSADRLVIDSSGNVGIGTSSPSYRLEVSDSNTTATQFSLDNTSTSGRNFRFLSTGSASGIGVGKFSIYDGDADGHRLVIDSSGNVGIGTSSPSAKLEVESASGAGNTNLFRLIRDGGYGDTTFNQWYTNGAGTPSGGNPTALYGLNMGLVVGSANNGKVAVRLESQGGSNTIDDSIVFRTANSDKVFIKSSGNVGIGTSSPNTVLDVLSTGADVATFKGSASGSLIVIDNASIDDYKIGGVNSVGPFCIYNNTDARYEMVFDGAGKVGIGTSSPAGTIEASDTNARIFITSDSSNNSILTLRNSSYYWNLNLDGSQGYLSFYNGSERMTIDSSGDVEINTGNLVIGTSGKGIDFSATSGSGTSELLDDYEEGTFTPQVYYNNGSDQSFTFTPGGGYTAQTGVYTKIGDTVLVRIRIKTNGLSGGSSSDEVRISGLPFAASSDIASYPIKILSQDFSANPPQGGAIIGGGTKIYLYRDAASTGALTKLQVSDLSGGTNNNDFLITAEYHI